MPVVVSSQRLPFVAVMAAVLSGCTCAAGSDYNFPEPAQDRAVDAPNDYGSWLSFDVDPTGSRLTMAYYDRQLGGLGYAVGNPSQDGTVSWAHERVDGYPTGGFDTVDAGLYASQATAPDGTVWVAYHEAEAGVLKVAQRAGPQQWTLSEVDAGGGDAGTWASLAIGGNGQPMVAHCDPSTAEVRMSRYDGSQWTTTVLFTSVEEPYFDEQGVEQMRAPGVSHTRVFVSNGTQYIAFRDEATQALNLLRGSGTTFTRSVVDETGDVGAWPSIAPDGDGVALAYHDVGGQQLKLATQIEGGWTHEVIDDGDLRGADTEIFDMDGQLAILYFDGYHNDMRLAVRNGATWTHERIDDGGTAVGFHNEVVRAGGMWWGGSYDHTNRTLFLQQL
ncbi:MAG: hypothetical protein KTR31_01145 [Myxococcales bacterium]|nr:hypothetical protein [Myxococcales bacterium]